MLLLLDIIYRSLMIALAIVGFYLMMHRYDFFSIYNMFLAFVKTQHNVVIKCFRCDLGGEYTSNKFFELLVSNGIVHQTSFTDTPEQNRLAERNRHHIIETTHSLLLLAFLLSEVRAEVILTIVHVIKRILSSITLGLSLFEKLYGCPLDYFVLRVFGSTSLVIHPHVEHNKLSSRSTKCFFRWLW